MEKDKADLVCKIKYLQTQILNHAAQPSETMESFMLDLWFPENTLILVAMKPQSTRVCIG